MYAFRRQGRMSESTVAAKAGRTLKQTPPVTVMEDLIGRMSPSKGQSNAVRDAIRGQAFDELKSTGYNYYDQAGPAKKD